MFKKCLLMVLCALNLVGCKKEFENVQEMKTYFKEKYTNESFNNAFIGEDVTAYVFLDDPLEDHKFVLSIWDSTKSEGRIEEFADEVWEDLIETANGQLGYEITDFKVYVHFKDAETERTAYSK